MQDQQTNTNNNQQISEAEEWLSIGDAAAILGISRDTLRRWEKAKKIKTYRSPTNRRLYKRTDLSNLYQFENTERLGIPSIISSEKPQRIPSSPSSHSASMANELITNTSRPISKTNNEIPQEAQKPSIQPDFVLAQPSNIALPSSSSDSSNVPTNSNLNNISFPTATTPVAENTNPPFQVFTPVQSNISNINEVTNGVSKDIGKTQRETKQVKVLKIMAISLSILLILLGIGVTVLVFL